MNLCFHIFIADKKSRQSGSNVKVQLLRHFLLKKKKEFVVESNEYIQLPSDVVCKIQYFLRALLKNRNFIVETLH